MPRVVPSDVVRAIDRMFPEMAQRPDAFPNMGFDDLPSLAALVKLVESVPEEVIVLEPRRYAELTASVSCLRAVPDVFQASRAPLHLRLRGFAQNPIALIRAAMAACPDEAPARETTALSFIGDEGLRQSIRLDISGANRDLTQGEWKGATVLAGSAIEALLLWALQAHETQKQGTGAVAIAALVGNKTLTRQPHANPERWDLHEYVEVAAHLGIIKPDTATLVRLAKGFRNLIHPGRALRLGEKCDRATALGALAAVEAVVRDLTP
jgi:hypothetical protein